MVRHSLSAEQKRPATDAIERAKTLTKSFGDDADLNAWAARMIAAADEFSKHKRSDPLGGFLPTHKR